MFGTLLDFISYFHYEKERAVPDTRKRYRVSQKKVPTVENS